VNVTELIKSLQRMPGDMPAAVAIDGKKPVTVTAAYRVVFVPYPGYVIIVGHTATCDGKHEQEVTCKDTE
jgi:hypothetical protein